MASRSEAPHSDSMPPAALMSSTALLAPAISALPTKLEGSRHRPHRADDHLVDAVAFFDGCRGGLFGFRLGGGSGFARLGQLFLEIGDDFWVDAFSGLGLGQGSFGGFRLGSGLFGFRLGGCRGVLCLLEGVSIGGRVRICIAGARSRDQTGRGEQDHQQAPLGGGSRSCGGAGFQA